MNTFTKLWLKILGWKKMIWTKQQVTNLNNFQRSGCFHPFTCGKEDCRADLVATINGWICVYDDYTQDWAHDFMLTFDFEEQWMCPTRDMKLEDGPAELDKMLARGVRNECTRR